MIAFRWMIRALIAAGVLGGGLFTAMHLYLQSEGGILQITTRLSALLGVPVKIGSVSVGLHSCSLGKMQLFAPDAPPNAEPWLSSDTVAVDLGYAEFVSGKIPEQLHLRGAVLRLTFDAYEHLITPFPKSTGTSAQMPPITIQGGSIIIARAGQPERVFAGVDATITAQTGKILIQGNANDSQWGGLWNAAGWFATSGGTGELSLTNPGLHVLQATLEKIPFVPMDVWRAVQFEGDTPVDLKLKFGGGVRYRVALSPTKTFVFVPSIDLRASETRGQVVIEDGLVQLRTVQGQVADGEIHVISSDLDFRGTNTDMRFDLAAYRLVLQKLPPTWKIPPRLGGKLSGKLALRVTVVGGLAIPAGQGEGRVDNAMLGRIPVPNYGLKVRADRDGFLFEPSLK